MASYSGINVSTSKAPDASALAQELRRRELSASEAVRSAIERIELINPAINAVVTKNYDQAVAAAKRADRMAARGEWHGPLHGVPILIKDLFDFCAGLRNTFGCTATVDFVPDRT